MKLLTGVVAHAQREARAVKLLCTVGATAYHLDDGTLKCEGNHIEVLSQLAHFKVRSVDDVWAVVLEDDAVPVPDFRKYLCRALQHAPAPVVGLYLGHGNPSGEVQRRIRPAIMAAEEKDYAWITADCLIGSVGYAVRFELVKDLVADIAGRDEELPLRISRWAQLRDIGICYTQPSLVNHDDSDSVNCYWRPANYTVRKAWKYGTRENWQTPAVQLGAIPRWSRQ